MDLRQLRGLVAIVDHGSFTAAARALHTTQPSLSYLINRLETELGIRLFDRRADGAQLTTVGQSMIEAARLTVHHADRVHSAANAATGLIVGRLSIAPVRSAVPALGPFLSEFHRRYPAVMVALEGPSADQDVVDAVRGGRCELGLCQDAKAAGAFRAIPLGRTGVIVVFPPGGGPRATSLTLEQLADYPLVAPVIGSPARRYFDAGLAAAGVQPEIAAESTDREMALALVRAGFGALLQPASVGEVAFQAGLDVVPVRGPANSRHFLIQRAGEPSPPAAAFCSVVSELLGSNADASATSGLHIA